MSQCRRRSYRSESPRALLPVASPPHAYHRTVMSSARVRTLLSWIGSERLTTCFHVLLPKAASRSRGCLPILSAEKEQQPQQQQEQQPWYMSLPPSTSQKRHCCRRRAPVAPNNARNQPLPGNSRIRGNASVFEATVVGGGGGCRWFSSTSTSPSASSTFEEDCQVIEECNLLLSSRLDIPE